MGESRTSRQGGFRVGDHVLVEFGGKDVSALIIEDRGEIGAGGRRPLRVQIPLTDTEPLELESPEAELRAAS